MQITPDGRLSIPQEQLERLGWTPETALEIVPLAGGMLVRPKPPHPATEETSGATGDVKGATGKAKPASSPAGQADTTLEWASFPGSSGLVERLGGTDAYMRFIRPGYGAVDDDDDGADDGLE